MRTSNREEPVSSPEASSESSEGERAMESCSPTTIRVLLVDDQTLFRVGLAHLLEADPRIKIVGEAADGTEAVRLAGSLKPEVVLINLKMPNLNKIGAT